MTEYVFLSNSFINLCIMFSSFYLFLFNLSSTSKPGPSFQRTALSAPEPVDVYIEGSPILTLNDQYFTIPQVSSVYAVEIYVLYCMCCQICNI